MPEKNLNKRPKKKYKHEVATSLTANVNYGMDDVKCSEVFLPLLPKSSGEKHSTGSQR